MSPATAMPTAKPRLTASRWQPNARTRRCSGTRSARRALAAGKYMALNIPTEQAEMTMNHGEVACESIIMAMAPPAQEMMMVGFRPHWSAMYPPKSPAMSPPAP